MSESKRTPGPWIVFRDNTDKWYKRRVYAGNNKLVANILDDNNEANARLIAAAPDLLEACEAALEYDAEIHRHAAINQKDPKSWVGCEELDRLYEKWTSASRAAIAKAKGEQP